MTVKDWLECTAAVVTIFSFPVALYSINKEQLARFNDTWARKFEDGFQKKDTDLIVYYLRAAYLEGRRFWRTEGVVINLVRQAVIDGTSRIHYTPKEAQEEFVKHWPLAWIEIRTILDGHYIVGIDQNFDQTPPTK